MDVIYLLKDVINLNEYSTITQDVLDKWQNGKNIKVTNNIATALTLKRIRSLEVEYLNKCDANGAACIVFEQLLSSPPSKVWGVLAKELICLLHYWLEAIRKHLIYHSAHWWKFLKLILKFIAEIRKKNPAIPNMLVEIISECLFELATTAKVDVFQRHTILHCLNVVCAESGREIRFAMRTKFGDYFVKIAANMATTGYLPCQYSSLECLLRWLLPRGEPALRAAAAERWFPRDLCPPAATALFLNSTWMNFFQDARDFLNALNEENGLVTSVVCRQLSIGNAVIINGTERQPSWLDFNTAGKSVSVLLDPKALQVFGVPDLKDCETLLIDDEITETALLRRESLGLTVSITTVRAPYIRPSDIDTGDERQVTIVISSRANLNTLDAAMRNTFGDKYQSLLDCNAVISQSPQRSYKNKDGIGSEEDTRFSHPVEVTRRRKCGYVVRTRNPVQLASPSSASTSSLLNLKGRLAALPKYELDKKIFSVCKQPALSDVSEVTEHNYLSTGSTAKFQPYGVGHRTFRTPINKTITEIESKSEGETVKPKPRGGRRLLSPVVSDDNSLLFVATTGTTNDSDINETIERLSKSKDFQEDNLVNLLVQDALQSQSKSEEILGSGINTDDKKSHEESEVINDTPNEIKETTRRAAKKKFTVISKSTTDDESNTEAINETPFVNPRKNIRCDTSKTVVEAEKHTVDFTAIEDFFSQHVSENNRGEVVISPTLAKKINETSSETSGNFNDTFFLGNEDINADVEQAIFNDIAVVDCLNDMVDKVCSDFDKCTGYLYNKNAVVDTDATVNEELSSLKNNNVQSTKRKPKKRKSVKLKYKPVKKAKAQDTKKTKDSNKKMSTITEHTEEDTFQEEINPETNENEIKLKTPKGTEAALLKKKRKLYSPKDDDIYDKIQQFTAEKSDEVPLSKIKTRNINQIPKTTATCYKELEKERKKYNTLPRIRKSKGKDIEMPSPRTLKMNLIFDNLKHNVENNESIKLVEKNSDVYNFTSDSEDEDFKKKKIDMKKKIVASTSSFESTTKKRNKRRAKESESSNEEAKKVIKRKTVTKRTKKKADEKNAVSLVKVSKVLDDERMREVVREDLNTSILIHHPINPEPEEIEPVITEVTQIEAINDSNDTLKSKKSKKTQMVIHDEQSNDTVSPKKRVNKRAKKIEPHYVKKEKGLALKNKTFTVSDKEDERTMSPLPGLVVESTNKDREDINDSLTTNMLQKFKRIYKDGPDPVNDTITTQNMLSDVERFNFSAQNCVNITEEIPFEDGSKENMKAKATITKNKTGKKVVPLKTIKTRSQKKIETKEKEIIEISDTQDTEVNDDQIEKSISSNGITAHGDSDENPPVPDSINEEIQPREIQDLDESMKDFFIKLTREIYNSTDGESINSVEGEEVSHILQNVNKKSRNNKTISPVVSVKRLSFECISKYMPSRRTSDSDSPPSSPKKKNTKTTTKTSRSISDAQTMRKTSTPDEKTLHKDKRKEGIISPVVSVKRLSFEEIDKWIPSRRSSDTDSQSSTRITNTSLKNVTRRKLSEPKLKSIQKPVASKRIKSPDTSPEMSPDSSKLPNVPLSRISLEEFNKWFPMPLSFESSQKEKSTEDIVKRSSKRCSVKALESPLPVLKRKSSSPILNEAKLRRIDDPKTLHPKRLIDDPKRKVEILSDVSIAVSGPSVSSVSSWLNRVGPSCHRETSMKDKLQNIMERIDTTRVEINMNTSKKFVNLCVGSQKQIGDQMEELRNRLHRSQTICNDILEHNKNMKKRAFEVIRENYRQNNVLMQVLKEDIQDVIDCIDKSRSNYSQ